MKMTHTNFLFCKLVMTESSNLPDLIRYLHQDGIIQSKITSTPALVFSEISHTGYPSLLTYISGVIIEMAPNINLKS